MFSSSFSLTNGMVSINSLPEWALKILAENPNELILLKRGANSTQTEKYWCWPVYINHSHKSSLEFTEESELNINHGEFVDFPDPIDKLIGFYTVGSSSTYVFS